MQGRRSNPKRQNTHCYCSLTLNTNRQILISNGSFLYFWLSNIKTGKNALRIGLNHPRLTSFSHWILSVFFVSCNCGLFFVPGEDDGLSKICLHRRVHCVSHPLLVSTFSLFFSTPLRQYDTNRVKIECFLIGHDKMKCTYSVKMPH